MNSLLSPDLIKAAANALTKLETTLRAKHGELSIGSASIGANGISIGVWRCATSHDFVTAKTESELIEKVAETLSPRRTWNAEPENPQAT